MKQLKLWNIKNCQTVQFES